MKVNEVIWKVHHRSILSPLCCVENDHQETLILFEKFAGVETNILIMIMFVLHSRPEEAFTLCAFLKNLLRLKFLGILLTFNLSVKIQ